MNWKEYFQNYRNIGITSDDDLLYQVGTTVGGKPISKQQFSCLIEEIKSKLELSFDDRLLDYCCGNGIITYELSKEVSYVVGVDGSSLYIKNAVEWKSAINIFYIHSDALDFDYIINLAGNVKYSKILFYGSLAYFKREELKKIFNKFNEITTDNCSILIGSILDSSKRFVYYNTLKRKWDFLVNSFIFKQDPGLGNWWSKNELRTLSKECGFDIFFSEQAALLHTAHYRFDMILKKQPFLLENL